MNLYTQFDLGAVCAYLRSGDCCTLPYFVYYNTCSTMLKNVDIITNSTLLLA
jgi:hypothetical protein